jgi:hypothetical protein
MVTVAPDITGYHFHIYMQMRSMLIVRSFSFKNFRLFFFFFLLLLLLFSRFFRILLEFELFLVISETPTCLLLRSITLHQLDVLLLLTMCAQL